MASPKIWKKNRKIYIIITIRNQSLTYENLKESISKLKKVFIKLFILTNKKQIIEKINDFIQEFSNIFTQKELICTNLPNYILTQLDKYNEYYDKICRNNIN